MDALAPHLPPELLRLLAGRGKVQQFAAGQTFIHEGETSDILYYLRSGLLQVYTHNDRGRCVILNELAPGALFGEMHLDGGPRSASVKAIEACECLTLRGGTVRTLIRAHPDFAEFMLLKLIAHLRHTTQQLRSIALDNVYERTTHLLNALAVNDGTGARRIPEKLTQQEIAERIGATREMVNQVLRDLIRGGYIVKEDRRRMAIIRPLPNHW